MTSQHEFLRSRYSSVAEEYEDGKNSYCEFFRLVLFLQLAIHLDSKSEHANLKWKNRKEMQLKFYKTIAVPILVYGSKEWVVKKKDTMKIQFAEIKLLRSVKECIRKDRI
jgi:hypothetical protein